MSDISIFHLLEDTSFYKKLKYSLNQNLIQFFAEKAMKDKLDLDVAELACGSGYGSHLLAANPRVRQSIALDISQELFDEKLGENFKAKYITGDIFSLPFTSNTFDLVWNSSAVEHFDEPLKAIQAMANVTKPGGHVFVGVPYLYGPLAVYYLAPTQTSRQWLGKPYSLKELLGMITRAGLVYQDHIVYFLNFFIGILAVKQ